MADKPKTNVDKFFEIYDADPALQARVQQAMDSYPGSLEIRDVMTEHVLLPVAEELGLPFTLKELRNYELLKWGRQHQDRADCRAREELPPPAPPGAPDRLQIFL